MNFNLRRPCRDCPFRTDNGFHLRVDRVVEILDGITRQQHTFSCHKTVNGGYGAYEGYVPTGDEQHCAGALILLEHIDRPNQMMRIAHRLDLYDPSRLEMDAPVFRSPAAMILEYRRRNAR